MNQYIKLADKTQKRHGKWKEKYPVEDGVLIATGKYKKGEKVGVWKTTYQDKIYQKDKIKNLLLQLKYTFLMEKLKKKDSLNLIFPKHKDIGIILEIGNIMMKMES